MSNNPRFLSLDIPPVGGLVTLDEEQAAHCIRVLRLRVGDSLSVINGRGSLGEGIIVDANPRRTVVELTSIESSVPSSQIQIAFGLTKPAALELIFRKCTELGVASFQPLITDHSIHPDSWNQERWKKIIVEACKQSQELWFPEIYSPISLEKWLNSRSSGRSLVFCDEKSRKEPTKANLNSPADILIGPEGGWSEAERNQLQKIGVTLLGLGPNRLRAETACLVALALVKSRLGEI